MEHAENKKKSKLRECKYISVKEKLEETERNLLHSLRNFVSKREIIYTRRNYSYL